MFESSVNQAVLPRCEYVIGSAVLRLVDQIEADPVTIAMQRLPADGTEFVVITNDMIAQHCHGRVSDELTVLRQAVTTLRSSACPWDQERVGSINDSFVGRRALLPETLKDQMGHDFLAWVEGAPDASLLEFMDWNERDLRPRQQTMLERIQHAQAFVLDDTKQLVDSGFLPERAYRLMESAIEATNTIHLADGYVTATEAGANAAAYYHQAKRRMGVRDAAAESAHFYEFVFHEYVHGAAAEGDADFQNLYGEADEDQLVWFNEAVTQHITAAALYGMPGRINPSERRDQSRIYEQQRDLLDLVLVYGESPIDIKEVVAAYFESSRVSDQPLRTALRTQMDASFRNLFPELESGLVLTIARECNAAPSPKAYDAVLKKWQHLISSRLGFVVDLSDEIPSDNANLKIVTISESESRPASSE